MDIINVYLLNKCSLEQVFFCQVCQYSVLIMMKPFIHDNYKYINKTLPRVRTIIEL